MQLDPGGSLEGKKTRNSFSVQFSPQSCPTVCDPWTVACQASLSINNSQSLLKLMSIELVMPSNHLIPYCPLLLPSVSHSIRGFSNESALHIRWPKYWNFGFNISPSNEHSGLISFRMDWLDLLAVQGTLKSLLQHHSSKASILWCSAFFIVQLEVHSCHLLFDHFQLAMIHGLNIPGSYAILLFIASDFTSITSQPPTGVIFALTLSLLSFWCYFSTDLP